MAAEGRGANNNADNRDACSEAPAKKRRTVTFAPVSDPTTTSNQERKPDLVDEGNKSIETVSVSVAACLFVSFCFRLALLADEFGG